MDIMLSPIESRILGCLIEKQITTPDYYPLTLNMLTNACNQKSNRDPVMNLDEKMVVRALDGLREKRLAWQVRTPGSRTPKYEHNMKAVFEFSQREMAVLCVLLLRKPQTAGEVRGRTGRMYKFDELSEAEETLHGLADREDGPFTVKLPRQTGYKERRYTHLFCGEPEIGETADDSPNPETARLEVLGENMRIAALEQKVADLETDLADMKRQFDEFAKQFE